MEAATPIRRQYLEVKRRYPNAIVFFRLGDFYETFDDDARLVAKELDITLTSKPMGKDLRVPLAGVPHHSLEGHLRRLVARGYKVAICEQMEDERLTCRHFNVISVEAFGLRGAGEATAAAGAILAYLEENQRSAVANVRDLRVFNPAGFLVLDPAARRHLEIFATAREGGRRG